MSVVHGFVLLVVMSACAGSAFAVCEHRKNEDMLEYACTGGDPSDLNLLPEETGKIRITGMTLYRITADTFSRFGPNLWVLACSHCGLVDIEPGAFRHLVNLEQLSLDNNRLTTVRADWFEGLRYLTYLDLNYNDIRSIEDGVFEKLDSLVDLRLSGNLLECLNLRDMSSLKELKRMFLSENPEFKCPHAVSEFLENRNVSFDEDPEWRRIPSDLVSPVPPPGEGEVPTIKSPSFRHWLHSTPAATTRIVPYQPPVPVEEVVIVQESTTPAWRPSERVESETTTRTPVYWTTTESYQADTRRPQAPLVPPTPSWRSSEPVESESTTRKPEYWTTESHQDGAGMPEVLPESPVPIERSEYPPPGPNLETSGFWWNVGTSTSSTDSYENGNSPSEGRPAVYSGVETRPTPSAPSQADRHRTPGFAEPNMEHTTDPDRWSPSDVPTEDEPTRYHGDDVNTPVGSSPVPETAIGHVIRPYVPSDVLQPASASDFFGAPYTEATATIRPPLENYHRTEPESHQPVETTTTDKPLPDCPVRGSARVLRSSGLVVWLAVLLVAMKDVLVDGF